MSRREDLQKALENMTADDPARENTEAELQELDAVVKEPKGGADGHATGHKGWAQQAIGAGQTGDGRPGLH